MLTFIWLIVWLCESTPHVSFVHGNTTWGIALAVCLGIDFIGSAVRR